MESKLTTVNCFVQNKNFFRFVVQIDEITAKNIPYSHTMKYYLDRDYWEYYPVNDNVNHIIYTKNPVEEIVVSGYSDLVYGSFSGAFVKKRIKDVSIYGELRELKYIDGEFYIVGMSRQVYRKDKEKGWVHDDKGMLRKKDVVEFSGLNSIDGLSSKNLFVVGFLGEIWNRKNNKWTKMDSPVSSSLHKVKVLRDDLVYAAGQLGTLLRFNGSNWKHLPLTHLDEHFDSEIWSIEWFNDKLYIATKDDLFYLNENDDLTLVNVDVLHKPTFKNLHANDGVLLSAGLKDAFWTNDGIIWHNVTPPF